MEDPNLPVEVLELLNTQNSGFAIREWMMARSNGSRDAKSTHFVTLIEKDQLRVLKALNFTSYCSLNHAMTRLLNEGRNGNSKKDGVK